MDPFAVTVLPEPIFVAPATPIKEDTVDPVTAALKTLIAERITEALAEAKADTVAEVDEDVLNDAIESYLDNNLDSAIESWVDNNLDVSDAVRDAIQYTNLSEWEDVEPRDFVKSDDLESSISQAVEDAISDLKSEVNELVENVDTDRLDAIESRLNDIEAAIRTFGGSI